MKYYIIAGEASGDLHGSKIMESIKKFDKKAKFRFWGGEKMKRIGGEIVKHVNQLSFMGFWEVLKNINTIYKNNSESIKNDIETFIKLTQQINKIDNYLEIRCPFMGMFPLFSLIKQSKRSNETLFNSKKLFGISL